MKGSKMSLIKIVSDTAEELFDPFEYPVLPPGKHLFIVANALETKPASDPASTNLVIGIEARCQDEDGNKGMVVFDNIVIVTDDSTSKAKKTKEIHDKKLAQFVAACGVLTPDEIKSGTEFDLADFKDKPFQAESKTAMEKVYPPELDAAGNEKKALKASIKQYLFDPTVT